MVKHTQTIRLQFSDKLSLFDHFVGLALKGLKIILKAFKYPISCSTKTLSLVIAPVLFLSVGIFCDASRFPEWTVKCAHSWQHIHQKY